MKFNVPNQVTTQFRQRGATMQCRVVLPDGRAFVGSASMTRAPELGWFGSKALRKIHHTFNGGVIGKIHKQVQNAVAKYLPIAKPFIAIHNAIASPIHKLIEGKKVRLKATAVAIAKATEKLPAAQRGPARKILAAKSIAVENARQMASQVALAKAVVKAKNAGKSAVKAVAVKGKPGVYQVIRPDGRRVSIPASRVH
jgi:hypothetical protein